MKYEIEEMQYIKAHKPFDIVECNGCFGYIQEVNINDGQVKDDQISYAVHWFNGSERFAWFDHDELKVHCNLFVEIAKDTCHPFGNNKKHVKRLLMQKGD